MTCTQLLLKTQSQIFPSVLDASSLLQCLSESCIRGPTSSPPALLSSLHLSDCLFHCEFSGLWVSWAVLVQVGVHFIF